MKYDGWPTEFLSQSVTTVLYTLSANQGPNGAIFFPKPELKNTDLKIVDRQHLHSWFSRCSEAVDGPDRLAIDDHIAVIGSIEWCNFMLTKVNIQVLATVNTTVDNYYWKQDTSSPDASTQDKFAAHYYRLDLDLNKGGKLFREPQPHLHTEPKGEPRINFNTYSDRTLIVDFIEFLFLNYAYDSWLIWAKNVWEREKMFADGEDPFPRIVSFYKDPIISNLSIYAKHISALRDILNKEKRRVAENLKLHPVTPNAQTLNYINRSAY